MTITFGWKDWRKWRNKVIIMYFYVLEGESYDVYHKTVFNIIVQEFSGFFKPGDELHF